MKSPNLFFGFFFSIVLCYSCRNANGIAQATAEPEMDNKAAEYKSKTKIGNNTLEMYSSEVDKKNVSGESNTNTPNFDKSGKKKGKKEKVKVDTKMAEMFDKLAIDLRTLIADELIDFSRTPEGMSMVFNPGVVFKYSSEILTDESKVRLDEITQILDKYPYADIMVEGHADSTGNIPRNKFLSETRAKNVALYMKSKGMKADRIAIAGYGATKPIASNKTEEGRTMNRRVLIRIKADEGKIRKEGE